jgi:DNA primase
MTVDEIKQQYSMSDILMRYGIKSNGIKKNISCPFHGKDKNPSMQIFQDGYNCYSCGRNGDIFKFVQEMENCSFKDAFLSLGGTYENTKTDFFAQQRLEKAKFEQEKRIKAEIRRKKQKRELSTMISYYKSVLSKLEPFSDTWCDCQNHIFYLLYAWEEKYIKGNEVDIGGVISRHSKSEFIRNIVR